MGFSLQNGSRLQSCADILGLTLEDNPILSLLHPSRTFLNSVHWRLPNSIIYPLIMSMNGK